MRTQGHRAFDQLVQDGFEASVGAQVLHVLHEEAARLQFVDRIHADVNQPVPGVMQLHLPSLRKTLAGRASENTIHRPWQLSAQLVEVNCPQIQLPAHRHLRVVVCIVGVAGGLACIRRPQHLEAVLARSCEADVHAASP